MDTISLAVKCTREEYMEFYATVGKKPLWTTVVGVTLLTVAVVLCMMEQSVRQHALLLLLLGVLTVSANPLILPMLRKGAAGRRYDNSDALRGALTVTVTRDTLTVRSACYDGAVPLAALTDVIQTKTMTALVFGKELTVCIPMRTMTADEAAALDTFLTPYKKEQV